MRFYLMSIGVQQSTPITANSHTLDIYMHTFQTQFKVVPVIIAIS